VVTLVLVCLLGGRCCSFVIHSKPLYQSTEKTANYYGGLEGMCCMALVYFLLMKSNVSLGDSVECVQPVKMRIDQVSTTECH
jgi:hypothetical protein